MTAPTDGSAGTFVGRAAEVDILRTALDQARAGQPRVVLIEGPPGIGKTALVDRFVEVETDVQVLRASGEPWEALVPYGVVDQLVRAAGASGAVLVAGRQQALPVHEPVS